MSNAEDNPLMGMTPAMIDVLDDMCCAWADKDRHGELEDEQCYGPEKLAAFYALRAMATDAFCARVASLKAEELPK